MTIFVIDKDKKENLGGIDFIPHREEMIIIKNSRNNLECKVACVVHYPKENSVLIFVNVTDNYYEKMFCDIKW